MAASFATSAAECNADPACSGFNNYAYLMVTGVAAAHRSWGTCLYTKQGEWRLGWARFG